uniref:Uncharacterized protein n=1 Tax=Myoviridae sp. ct35n35 TaxID=2823534 RepID=A0A8S5LCX9_9CAUD|nr:MAG TPA: hypothetical protein [Myoviridae sp. ct35n35]
MSYFIHNVFFFTLKGSLWLPLNGIICKSTYYFLLNLLICSF